MIALNDGGSTMNGNFLDNTGTQTFDLCKDCRLMEGDQSLVFRLFIVLQNCLVNLNLGH